MWMLIVKLFSLVSPVFRVLCAMYVFVCFVALRNVVRAVYEFS